MLADSVMSEIIAGSRQVQAVSTTTFDMSEPAWTYSIEVDSTDYEALVAVRVSVAQQLAAELHPAHCDLVRWLPNPDYIPPNADQQSTTNSTSNYWLIVRQLVEFRQLQQPEPIAMQRKSIFRIADFGLRIESSNPQSAFRNPQFPLRPAFTLFELLLAIALSATLLILIGTAINLYLLRVDTGRTEVEESQLARNILAMIAADIRATSVYQTQDISAIAQLAAAAATFDADSIDKSGTFQASAFKTLSSLQTKGTLQATNGQSSSSSSGAPAQIHPAIQAAVAQAAATRADRHGARPQRLVEEIDLDVNHLPRPEELFPPGQQPTATSSRSSSVSAAARPTDARTVHYFIRQGNAMDPSDIAATSLSGTAQQQAGGLVRQTIDQAVRAMAESRRQQRCPQYRPGADRARGRSHRIPILRCHPGRSCRHLEHARTERDAASRRSPNLACQHRCRRVNGQLLQQLDAIGCPHV